MPLKAPSASALGLPVPSQSIPADVQFACANGVLLCVGDGHPPAGWIEEAINLAGQRCWALAAIYRAGVGMQVVDAWNERAASLPIGMPFPHLVAILPQMRATQYAEIAGHSMLKIWQVEDYFTVDHACALFKSVPHGVMGFFYNMADPQLLTTCQTFGIPYRVDYFNPILGRRERLKSEKPK